ncbi:MAG: tetratricopeptide repeat protein [Gammaproteobacteria bacterium]
MLLDASKIDAEYQRGHAAHMAGDLDTAADIYERVLIQSPEHALTLHALGSIHLRRGNINRAEALIRQAIAADPLGVGFNNSLGNVFVSQGLFSEARRAYESELQLRPDFAIAHNQLGSLALLQKRPDLAVTHFQTALKFAPQFAVAANNLGRALNNDGRHAEAAEAFRHALRVDGEFGDAHANLGHVLRVLGEHKTARHHFERALGIDERLGRAHRGLAQLDIATGNSAAALSALEKAVQIDAGDIHALGLLGAVLHAEGMLVRSAEVYEKALDLYPDDPDLLSDAAAVSRAAGNTDLARERYKAALSHRSTHQNALAGYALLMAADGDAKGAAARLAPSVNSGRAGPELLSTYADILGQLGRRREGIALLETALQKRQPADVARRLHFALAALLDGEGSYDLAFFHCRRANDERPTDFDPVAFNASIDEVVRNFSASQTALPASDWHEPAPVFVIGLPRSGVRVLSRLMAPHTQVMNLGNASSVENSLLRLWNEAGSVWPALAVGLTAQDASRAAHRAVSGRLPADCTQPYFMDANWRNFFYVGAIAQLFPGAKFIECTRDARDVARSCYFFNATAGKSMPFATDLRHIAAYVNGYRRLMDHWRHLPNVTIHRVPYEQLVVGADAQCRQISDYLQIPYAKSDYALDTSDTAAWHLDAKALRRYRHYRSHLEAFTDALDAPHDA